MPKCLFRPHVCVLRFIVLQVCAQGSGERLVLLLISQFRRAASAGNGARIATVFRVHWREHLEDFWLLRARKFR